MPEMRGAVLLTFAVCCCLGTPDVNDHNLYSRNAPLYTLYQTGLDPDSLALEKRITQMEGQVGEELAETDSEDRVSVPHERLVQLGMSPAMVANMQRLLEDGEDDENFGALASAKKTASTSTSSKAGQDKRATYQVRILAR